MGTELSVWASLTHKNSVGASLYTFPRSTDSLGESESERASESCARSLAPHLFSPRWRFVRSSLPAHARPGPGSGRWLRCQDAPGNRRSARRDRRGGEGGEERAGERRLRSLPAFRFSALGSKAGLGALVKEVKEEGSRGEGGNRVKTCGFRPGVRNGFAVA